MPTIGLDTKITFATSKARTEVNSFYRALSVDGMTTKVLTLAPDASGSLSLLNSEFVILLCIEDCLTVTLTNEANEQSSFLEIGFLVIKASNLKTITITNLDEVSREISIYY
jgi:hypothetical protein